jgi:rhodanese-related sulfurtransferase
MRSLIAGFLLCITVPAFATEKISAIDANKLVRSGEAILVDVRESPEIADGGMAEPAYWIPTSGVDASSSAYKAFVAGLNRAKTIIVYCRGGSRAAGLAEKLEKLGFKTANMGGFSTWIEAKLPTRSKP